MTNNIVKKCWSEKEFGNLSENGVNFEYFGVKSIDITDR